MHRDAATGKHLQRGQEQRVLARQHPRRQLFGTVAGQDRDARLRDHRAGIQLRHHQMHAGTMLCIAGFQRARVRVQAAVFG